MSGSRESLRNGQAAQYLSSQSEVYAGKKKSGHRYFAIPFVILFAVTCVAFVGFLYYLDVRLGAEISNYNEKVNQELKIYSENINARLEEFDNQIKQLSTEIAECRDKNKSPLQLGSDIMKFKGVTIQNMEEFPEIEDVDTNGLVDVSKNKKNSTRSNTEDPLGPINTTITTDKDKIELFKMKMLLIRQNLANMSSPDDILKDNEEDSVEGEEEDGDEAAENFHRTWTPSTEQQKRRKRSAEMANSGGLNEIDTSPEVFDRNPRSNQTEFHKTSPSQNQTIARSSKIQWNSTPYEEPHKMPHLPKTIVGKALQMKKSAGELRSPAAFETENVTVDIIETPRTIIAAHFGADSSKYNPSFHPQYEGNHFLRHPTGEHEDWRPSSWFDELNMDKQFTLMNGNIKVHTTGLYFVYAQIYYMDSSEVNGYEVYLNSQVVLQCVTSAYSLKNLTNKSNTCFTGGLIKCGAGDTISVKTTTPGRRIILEATRSFVGLFKVGEFQLIK